MHGALIARNVLLADGNVPKLSDFGLPRSGSGAQLKWLAPEAVAAIKEKKGASTKAADVFSYGCVLFALFAQEMPWKGVGIKEAGERVLGGERLQLPSSAPPWASELSAGCFQGEPKQRPKMQHILDVFAAHGVIGKSFALQELDATSSIASRQLMKVRKRCMLYFFFFFFSIAYLFYFF